MLERLSRFSAGSWTLSSRQRENDALDDQTLLIIGLAYIYCIQDRMILGGRCDGKATLKALGWKYSVMHSSRGWCEVNRRWAR